MSYLESINPDQLSLLAVLIALLLSKEGNAGELNVWGNFIVAIGSILLTIAAQKEFQEKAASVQDPSTTEQIARLQLQIDQLYKKSEWKE